MTKVTDVRAVGQFVMEVDIETSDPALIREAVRHAATLISDELQIRLQKLDDLKTRKEASEPFIMFGIKASVSITPDGEYSISFVRESEEDKFTTMIMQRIGETIEKVTKQ